MAKKLTLSALMSTTFSYEFSDGVKSDFEYKQQSTKQTLELEKKGYSVSSVLELMKKNTKALGKKSVDELYDDVIESHDLFDMKLKLDEELRNLSKNSTDG